LNALSSPSWIDFLDDLQVILDAHKAVLSWRTSPVNEELRLTATQALRHALKKLMPSLDLALITDFLQPLLKAASGPDTADSNSDRVKARELVSTCRDLLRELSGMRQSSGASDRDDRQELILELSEVVRSLEALIWPLLNDLDLLSLWRFLAGFCSGKLFRRDQPLITEELPVGALAEPAVGLRAKPQPSKPKVEQPAPQPKPPKQGGGEVAGKEVKTEVPGLVYRINYLSPTEEGITFSPCIFSLVFLLCFLSGELLTLIDGRGWSTELARRTQQYVSYSNLSDEIDLCEHSCRYGFIYDYSAVKNKDREEKRLTMGPAFPHWLHALAERLHKDALLPWTPNQVCFLPLCTIVHLG